jgi:hypothetical protein
MEQYGAVIFGSCSGWNKLFCLLGYYMVLGGLRLTFWDYLSFPSSKVKLSWLIGSPKVWYQATVHRIITQETEAFSMEPLHKSLFSITFHIHNFITQK